MAFSIPNSQIKIDDVAAEIPALLLNFAQEQAGFNGLKLAASKVVGPVFEAKYGQAHWTMKIENTARVYRGKVVLTGALDADQNIKFFVLGGVVHEETTRLMPDLAAVEKILAVATPKLEVLASY